MSTGRPHGRVASLDGVRGVAILLVLIGHAGASYRIGALGAAGVTLFFTLSGYLITGILRTEIQRTGRLRLGRFYWRRLTRLGPPLLVMLVVTAPLLRPSWEALVPAATWTGNYATLLGLDIRPYGHTWSLGVEEQFYLVWPLALLGLVRFRDRTVRVVAGILFVLVSWRLLLTAAGELRYAYVAFETAGTAILGGCLVSLAQWRLPGRWAVFGVGGILAVAFAVAASPFYWLAWLVVPVLVTAAAVVLVAAAENTRWLETRWLAFAGVTSYSMYLYHEPVTQLISGRQSPWGVALGAGVGLVAYFCVEAPLMRWRAGGATGARVVDSQDLVVAEETR